MAPPSHLSNIPGPSDKEAQLGKLPHHIQTDYMSSYHVFICQCQLRYFFVYCFPHTVTITITTTITTTASKVSEGLTALVGKANPGDVISSTAIRGALSISDPTPGSEGDTMVTANDTMVMANDTMVTANDIMITANEGSATEDSLQNLLASDDTPPTLT